MAPPLPGPLANLVPLLEDHGYVALGVLVLLDNGGIPVPGQTILVLAAATAGTGRLDITVVLTVAVLAAVAGDCLGYLVGRSGGRAFVRRWGRYLLLTPARLEKAEDFFDRRGPAVVTVARFVDVLRQTNGIIAGTVGMPWRRFLVYNVLGAVLWVAVWGGLGFAAGTRIGEIYAWFVRSQLTLVVAACALLILLATRWWLHHRNDR
ncbi:DedA family protein [Streptomyces sp. GC420]|uniref:DedA family protein n=1 Tax=Streptomyces sp. GC420 TaxID=2697568 RepID=UPI001414E188|nr:DedA family protein [Streptomyces sp. GC420]NBM20166.1 DedA family protein [Streptomyces sp. GC420]